MVKHNFSERHPFPLSQGVEKLYRYFAFDKANPRYVSDLLASGLLYFSKPSQFNDPFECKPNWRYPSDVRRQRQLKSALKRIVRSRSRDRDEAHQVLSSAMRGPSAELEESVRSAAAKAFQDVRICCFSDSYENLLLWSHYADSHRGYCVGFDASHSPFRAALKVFYQDDYPNIDFPVKAENGFDSVLTKYKLWEYESEYRAIFVPGAEAQPTNHDEFCILQIDAITDVYLGALIEPANEQLVLKSIAAGEYLPNVWKAKLSESSFALDFKLVGKTNE